MRGKEKCKALKEIRKKIAESNDIEYAVTECSHQGDCKGTCPKCEAELRYLERELERRVKLGKTAVVAGLTAIATMGFAGCKDNEKNGPLSGDVTQAYTEDLAGAEEPYPEPLDGEAQTVTEEILAGEETCEPTEEISTEEATTEAHPSEGSVSK